MSGIQWTDQTWNPVVGCTPVSPGCLNCYAAAEAPRLGRMGARQYVGVTVARTERGGDRRDVFNGTVRTVEDQLGKPLRRKKPTRYFIASMGDLFHEAVPFEFIDRVFTIMSECQRHTFQVLTKRPERAAEYFARDVFHAYAGPLPNVWLGTSAEDQARLDERVPHLLRCPAAVRFLSCEPLLGPLEIEKHVRGSTRVHMCMDIRGAIRNRSFEGMQHPDGTPMTAFEAENCLWELHANGVRVIPIGSCDDFDDQKGCRGHRSPRVDWVIVGGESGPQARFCEASWIRGVLGQCRAASVPVFIKQLGSRCLSWGDYDGTYADWDFYWSRGYVQPTDNWELPLRDRKGGDPDEWPADLRVREFPKVEVTL